MLSRPFAFRSALARTEVRLAPAWLGCLQGVGSLIVCGAALCSAGMPPSSAAAAVIEQILAAVDGQPLMLSECRAPRRWKR
jgi:hypothetical protein